MEDYGHMLNLNNPTLRSSILYSDPENEKADQYYEKELTPRQKRANMTQKITDLAKAEDK